MGLEVEIHVVSQPDSKGRVSGFHLGKFELPLPPPGAIMLPAGIPGPMKLYIRLVGETCQLCHQRLSTPPINTSEESNQP